MKHNKLGEIGLIILILITISSCSPQKADLPKAVIKGKYFPFEEHIFLSRVTTNNVTILDSADLNEGRPFTFKVNAADYTIHRLAHKELYPLLIILTNGDTAEITQVDDKAWPYRVKGSSECMLLVNYLERLNRDHYKVDSLAAIFHYSQDHPDFVLIRDYLNQQFKILLDEHKEYAREFVMKYPSSLASIVVINGFFKEFALFHQSDDFNYYELADNALMNRIPENRHVKDFHQQVANIREGNEYELEAKMRLSPGRLVPEFSLPSTSGEKVGPQDFKGNVLLMYFWAGADAKSRQTNAVIKSTYEAYHKYGLELLAISFDKDPSVWENAIRLDELPGVHLTDLKGAGSPVQQLFNLKMQLPYYYLIDTKGRIFKHDRDFSKLQQKIIEIYKQPSDF